MKENKVNFLLIKVRMGIDADFNLNPQVQTM